MQVITLMVGMFGVFTLAGLGAWSLSGLSVSGSAHPVALMSVAHGLAQGHGANALVGPQLLQLFGLWAGMYAFSVGLCQTLLWHFRPLLSLLTIGIVFALGLWFSHMLSLWHILAYFPAGMVLLAVVIRQLWMMGD